MEAWALPEKYEIVWRLCAENYSEENVVLKYEVVRGCVVTVPFSQGPFEGCRISQWQNAGPPTTREGMVSGLCGHDTATCTRTTIVVQDPGEVEVPRVIWVLVPAHLAVAFKGMRQTECCLICA